MFTSWLTGLGHLAERLREIFVSVWECSGIELLVQGTAAIWLLGLAVSEYVARREPPGTQ